MAVNVSEAEVSTLIMIGQLRVIDAELVKDGGLKVMNMNRAGGEVIYTRINSIPILIHDVVAEVISVSVNKSRLHSTACHPNRERARVMVPTIVFLGKWTLTIYGATKFSSPYDESVLK